MTKTTLLTVLIASVFVVGSLASNEAFAAVDMFLKIEGIDGESKDSAHGGEIELLSWSWGETNSGTSTGGGGGAGKVSMQDFNFVMEYEKASPKLMQACAEGQHFPETKLTLRRAGAEYLIITMKDVLVSSYQTGGSSGDVVPVDSLSLNFGAIKFEYKPQSEDGSTEPPVIGTATKRPTRA